MTGASPRFTAAGEKSNDAQKQRTSMPLLFLQDYHWIRFDEMISQLHLS
jgi:hypothetical protein